MTTLAIITIQLSTGPREIFAEVVAPGLAIHDENGLAHSGCWTLTHIPSGLGIGQTFGGRGEALAAALEIGTLGVPWEQNGDEVLAFLKMNPAIKERVKARTGEGCLKRMGVRLVPVVRQ